MNDTPQHLSGNRLVDTLVGFECNWGYALTFPDQTNRTSEGVTVKTWARFRGHLAITKTVKAVGDDEYITYLIRDTRFPAYPEQVELEVRTTRGRPYQITYVVVDHAANNGNGACLGMTCYEGWPQPRYTRTDNSTSFEEHSRHQDDVTAPTQDFLDTLADAWPACFSHHVASMEHGATVTPTH